MRIRPRVLRVPALVALTSCLAIAFGGQGLMLVDCLVHRLGLALHGGAGLPRGARGAVEPLGSVPSTRARCDVPGPPLGFTRVVRSSSRPGMRVSLRAVSVAEPLEQLHRRSSMHEPMYRGQLAAHPDAIELPAAGEARTRFGTAPRMSLSI